MRSPGLAETGQRTEALAASLEAVDLHRELVALNRDAYLPNLAASVNNHANRLAEAGRGTEALATSLEAVSLRRELFRLNRDAYQPALATSLWNVGVVALKTDSVTTDEVVELTAEGVSLFEILAAETPAAFAEQHRAAARTLARVRERENTNDRPSDRLA
ncbi:hypothetical protein [Actinoplanes solisilvae]|uniref:hypothetical protein n=1 Tax=Actinoplanes solisilvae TaxID=2486853 RepID=UPI000FD7DD85|nr:hypothetical protein [Actinoplanes solisilvae]